jgi:hypothetical protein
MEFSKKNLIKIMEEVNSMEVGEMARRTDGKSYLSKDPTPRKQAPRTKDGQFEAHLAIPGWHPDNTTPMGDYGIPDYWVINPTERLGDEELVVPLDCEDIEDFMSRYSEWLESLKLEYGLEPQLFKCRQGNKPTGKVYKPPYSNVPLRQKYGIIAGKNLPSYERTGGPKPISIQEKILRYHFYPLMRESFIDGDFAKTLEYKSIPCVSVDEKNIDNHSEDIDNNRFEFNSHSYELFETVNDFIEAIQTRTKQSKGKIDLPNRNSEECESLARQYNLIYRKWLETTQNKQKYQGKTPKYMLDRFGLEEKNLNIATRLDVNVTGNLNEANNTYRWEINLTVSFGKKLENEFNIIGGLNRERTFSSVKEVSYELDKPYTEFNQEYTILDNPSIKSGLIEAIGDIQNQISSLKSSWMLPLATATRLNVNESTDVERLIGRILKEIKK